MGFFPLHYLRGWVVIMTKKLGFEKFTRQQIRALEARIKIFDAEIALERKKGSKANWPIIFNLEADRAYWLMKLRQGGEYVR